MAFGVKHLLFVVLVAAVGLAAFMNPHRELARNLVNVLTVTILVLFAYGIWTSTGEQRAFRVGFFAWCALFFFDFTRNNLGLEMGIGDLIEMIGPANPRSSDQLEISRERLRYFYIGRCLIALLFGLIGGWVTVYFYRKRQTLLERQI